jgi:polysaccharide deacetylase family protein (PEP-CTERM system associated)
VPASRESIINAFSIDVEDYFHVEAFASRISPQEWPRFASRVESNVELILDILARRATIGTFFVLGWVAERFPYLVRRIADCGHEIGCHGYGHQHIMRQTPEQFREDIRRAKECLAEQAQQPICCYRAPSFSVTKSTLWALNILAEEGFRVDSSIFPVRHDLYGMPDSDRFPHWRNGILEFPPTTIRVANNNLGVAGGGYLRLLPYRFTRWAIQKINEVEKQPAMVYFHPWELDPDQPRISAPFKSRLRHYTNLSGMQNKIERLLQDFRFTTVTNVLAANYKGCTGK